MNPRWLRSDSCRLSSSDIIKTAPHGRLIDAAEFRKKLNEMFLEEGADQSTLLKVLEELEKMPTIIEAEG